MATFNADLATGQVARFNMVIPNGCDDGEANCKPVNNRYTQFDDFLAAEVPKIEASPAFGSNGVIIVTYDEDERAGGLAPKNGLGSGGPRRLRDHQPARHRRRLRPELLPLQPAAHPRRRVRPRRLPRQRQRRHPHRQHLAHTRKLTAQSAAGWPPIVMAAGAPDPPI